MSNVGLPPKPVSKFGLPPKPERPGPDADEEKRLQYQQDLQKYNFAVQQALNAITQEGMAKSNLQKAANDAITQMLNNLR